MKVIKERKEFFYFVLALFAILSILPLSSALTENVCATAEVTDISPSSIDIGEEFTVGVQVESCGNKVPDFIYFELISPPADISIKEPLIINISRIYYANSERFINYHMKSSDDASPGTHVIKTRLTYGESGYYITKNGEISFEIVGEKAELNIASIKSDPILPVEGDTVELTLRVENSGDGNAKSIKVSADHPFQGVKQTFVGTLKPDEDGPAVFTFITNKSGEFEFPVTISYYDDFGEKEVKTNVELTILEKKTNIKSIIFSIVVILLVGWGIFYFFKMKKSKDKIIHQLLNNNGFREKNKK